MLIKLHACAARHRIGISKVITYSDRKIQRVQKVLVLHTMGVLLLFRLEGEIQSGSHKNHMQRTVFKIKTSSVSLLSE